MLPKPQSDQAYIHISALEGGVMQLKLQIFVKGASATDIATCPSLGFLLTHSRNGKQIIFDLGCRRDMETHPPLTYEFFQKWTPMTVPQTVVESLAKGGVHPNDIDTAIISHLHYDHVGDTSAFPKTRFMIGGDIKERLLDGYPINAKSTILASSVPLDRTTFLGNEHFTESIGPFPRAFDYFGDGSLYIIDAAGHMAGHINVLARTSAEGSWILLAGDSAHHPGILSGEKEIYCQENDLGVRKCAHENPQVAIEHIGRLGVMAKTPKVHVLLAHDWEWYKENKDTSFLPGRIQPKE